MEETTDERDHKPTDVKEDDVDNLSNEENNNNKINNVDSTEKDEKSVVSQKSKIQKMSVPYFLADQLSPKKKQFRIEEILTKKVSPQYVKDEKMNSLDQNIVFKDDKQHSPQKTDKEYEPVVLSSYYADSDMADDVNSDDDFVDSKNRIPPRLISMVN